MYLPKEQHDKNENGIAEQYGKGAAMELTENLKNILYGQGAVLVGVGDMSQVENCKFPYGISVAVPIPKQIVKDLQKEPTREYYEMCSVLNNRLDEIVSAGEEFLKSKGYEAFAQTTNAVKVSADRTTAIPHKTVATRAGIGWIGKNCLLVTEQYGGAIRLSSVLTDAPLIADEAVTCSRCGDCALCVKACPAKALQGVLWQVGIQREDIVNIESCHRKQEEMMRKRIGIKKDSCGKCFAVCRYTAKYLNRQENNQ